MVGNERETTRRDGRGGGVPRDVRRRRVGAGHRPAGDTRRRGVLPRTQDPGEPQARVRGGQQARIDVVPRPARIERRQRCERGRGRVPRTAPSAVVVVVRTEAQRLPGGPDHLRGLRRPVQAPQHVRVHGQGAGQDARAVAGVDVAALRPRRRTRIVPRAASVLRLRHGARRGRDGRDEQGGEIRGRARAGAGLSPASRQGVRHEQQPRQSRAVSRLRELVGGDRRGTRRGRV
mmetsp:Transcript_89/g.453  ORF Transcript_89/g.453 Transcript_89/m.453 type:complete len:233 (+) Transcript_89:353-1051(+)